MNLCLSPVKDVGEKQALRALQRMVVMRIMFVCCNEIACEI